MTTTRVCDCCDHEFGDYESAFIHIPSMILSVETCQHIYDLDFCSVECLKEWIRIIIEGAEK